MERPVHRLRMARDRRWTLPEAPWLLVTGSDRRGPVREASRAKAANTILVAITIWDRVELSLWCRDRHGTGAPRGIPGLDEFAAVAIVEIAETVATSAQERREFAPAG